MPGQLAWPGKVQAQIYWKGVGCDTLFAGTGSDARNTWWYRGLASAGKSSQADDNLNWRVVSAGKGSAGATAAFPLNCSIPAPDAPTPTPVINKKSEGRSSNIPEWRLLLAMLVTCGSLIGSFF